MFHSKTRSLGQLHIDWYRGCYEKAMGLPRSKSLLAAFALAALFGSTAAAQIDPNSRTTQQPPILYRTRNYFDAFQQQQSGSATGENQRYASAGLEPVPEPTAVSFSIIGFILTVLILRIKERRRR